MSYILVQEKSWGLCGSGGLVPSPPVYRHRYPNPGRNGSLKAHRKLVVASGWEVRSLDVNRSVINRCYTLLQKVFFF